MDTQVTPHFKLSNLVSPDSGEIFITELFWEHMELLEELRCNLGSPLIVNSGHRSIKHNTKVGGAARSMHLRFATDLNPRGPGKVEKRLEHLYEAAKDLGFAGIGRYNSFVHLDRRDLIGRRPAEWDKRT
jgi:uncharacterized protein YcbK (DUF882 family)